ncbi:MAG: hypothetical protein HC877_02015 [Thioploca sp.]|nr:hypothetical protein [Thioploca sp.]
MTKSQLVEGILEYFVDHYTPELTLSLMKILAYPSQGGLGYRIEVADPIFGWDVDKNQKVITLDTHGMFSQNSTEELALQLREALEVEFLETRASLLSRIGWGTGKLVVGLVETGIGVVGIIVPEPGTTAAGVTLTVLGVNTIGDAITQYAGINQGQGINLLEEGFAQIGSTIAELAGGDPRLGDTIGRGSFLVSSIVIGSVAAFRVLHINGQSLIRMGVGGQPGGIQIGRIQALYPNLRGNGMTVFSLVNNQGQSFLRFVFQNGRLYANGRIVGVQNILRHESNWRTIAKGLLKLLWHGAKTGL